MKRLSLSRSSRIELCIALAVVCALLLLVHFHAPRLSLESFALLITVTFLCEFIDSTAGMGFGTLLLPVLIFMGFDPIDAVSAILVSETVTGISASIGHHAVGNVDFHIGSRAWWIAIFLGLIAVCTSPIAAFLSSYLKSETLLIAIGYLVLIEGLVIIALRNISLKFSWGRMIALGMFASFIKSLSGGGFGPIMTGGQVIIGIDERHALSITSLSETIVCFFALAWLIALGGEINQSLVYPVLLGAFLSVFPSVLAVRYTNTRILHSYIGILSLGIGIFLVFMAR